MTQHHNPTFDNDHNENQARRFAGVAKIYGHTLAQHFAQSHVMVIGIGGVGSWAVEALARTGIGQLTLVDMDVLVASNINRQLPALDSTLGQNKIDVMAERCREINPQIKIQCIDEFINTDNIPEIITTMLTSPPDVILDCIDDLKAKLALILYCRFNKIPLIVSGGAGGKTDPSKIRVADLAKTEQDPMLAKLRSQLRQKGISTSHQQKFGIPCIYSVENPAQNRTECPINASAGLRCGGYGSTVVMTNGFAMFAVAEVLKKLQQQYSNQSKQNHS